MLELIGLIVLGVFVIAFISGYNKANPRDEPLPPEAVAMLRERQQREERHDRRTLRIPIDAAHLRQSATYSSDSERGVKRHVHLAEMTCDCPDFARREDYEPLDIRRLCKHLQRALVEFHREKLPSVYSAFLSDPYLQRYQYFHVEELLGHDVAFMTSDDSEWVNVYARHHKKKDPSEVSTGRYIRYGFCPGEQRWASGDTPYNATLLESRIAGIFRKLTF